MAFPKKPDASSPILILTAENSPGHRAVSLGDSLCLPASVSDELLSSLAVRRIELCKPHTENAVWC